jgi:hypothetical protein
MVAVAAGMAVVVAGMAVVVVGMVAGTTKEMRLLSLYRLSASA